MSTRNSKTTSFRSRWWLAGALLALGLAVFLVLMNSGQQPEESVSVNGAGADPSASLDGSAAPHATRSSHKRIPGQAELTASQFPQVERILTDDSLSESLAAKELCVIARSRELSEGERAEALAHGLNLDFGAFAALATDPSLPVDLAQRYFEGLANHGDRPKQQIEGYLGLMGHGDQDIRTQATEQLAFVLENEELAGTPEKLRQLALERLQALKLAPPEQAPPGTDGSAAGPAPE